MNTALFTFRNSEGFEPLAEIPDVSLKRKDTVSRVLARKVGCVFLDIRRQPDNEEGVAFRVTARSEAEMIVSQICIWLRG